MKVYRRSDGYEPVDLLRYAVDHREASLLLFKHAFEFHDSAGYLGHLSVELLLKSLALHFSGQFVDGHGLMDQLDNVRNAGLNLEMSGLCLDALKTIDADWNIRYPHPGAPRAVGHSPRDALRRIWACIVSRVPEELNAAFLAAPANQKGGRVLMIRRNDGERE